ncbi:response regulator transcription factor [Gryllotalpicola koreensis]|uniref:Response regulatory domain-containing protein n=1 Tax=Gryllotalpicola koreensis TaxID=993086 RepID=A0ABP7ZPC0_9MICO
MDRHALRSAVVIEDDDGIRSLIHAVLQRAGLNVIEAANGADGIEAVRAHAPAIITVDIRMPGIDGFETTRRIREISDAAIIVLSAHVADADESESLAAGADVYMRKPFRPRELRAFVDERLRAARSAETQAAGSERVSSSSQAKRPSDASSPKR